MATALHSIDTLPALARTLLIRTGGADHATPRLTQLRRKPGRGLTALLIPVAGPRMWLRLEETALRGSGVTVTDADLLTTPLRGAWPGSVHVDEAGVSLETAGADAGLAGLAAALAPAPGSALWPALESAARRILDDPRAHLAAAGATTVRHKPGSRCVLRHALTVTRGRGGDPVRVGVFAKLFADAADAVSSDRLLHALYAEQAAAGRPVVPRPLGAVGSLGIALTAAVGEDGAPPVSGAGMLRPPSRRTAVPVHIPAEALAAAATALAALHRSAVTPPGGRRAGDAEAASVRKRTALLAAHAPSLATGLHAAGAQLAVLLTDGDGAATAPVHGGFKPSQLVYTDPRRVTITDFDGFRLGDPALDVGYFLAYLRPASLWRGGAASRAWFTAAAAVFTTAYARAMLEAGAAPAEVAGTLRRAPLHEAATLLKIAGRRPNRCNAPRLRELTAMLREIESRLVLQPSFSAVARSSAPPPSPHQRSRSSWSPSPAPHGARDRRRR